MSQRDRIVDLATTGLELGLETMVRELRGESAPGDASSTRASAAVKDCLAVLKWAGIDGGSDGESSAYGGRAEGIKQLGDPDALQKLHDPGVSGESAGRLGDS